MIVIGVAIGASSLLSPLFATSFSFFFPPLLLYCLTSHCHTHTHIEVQQPTEQVKEKQKQQRDRESTSPRHYQLIQMSKGFFSLFKKSKPTVC